MRRWEEPNGWYSDATIEGAFASLITDQFIRLGSNSVPLPELPRENPLFLVLTQVQGINFLAGQGGITGDALIYSTANGVWKRLCKAFGTYPVYFWKDRLFVVSAGDEYKIYNLLDLSEPPQTVKQQIGVNGIRWVEDGRVITGDETYRADDKEPFLAEYTTLGNVTVGQSYTDGCVASLDLLNLKARLKLESGDCRHIRLKREGDNLAITIVKQEENKAVFYWLTRNELLFFPPEEVPSSTDPPKEEPPKKEEPKMQLPEEVRRTRDTFIGKFPFPYTPEGQEVPHDFDERFRSWFGKLVEQIVFSHPNQGYGWKRAGGPPSKDSIANNRTGLKGWDMFLAVGTGRPQVIDKPESTDISGQTFIEVRGVDHLGTSIPNPGPQPTPDPVPGNPNSPELGKWVNEEVQIIVDKYKEKHGNDPSYQDIGFQAWRRLKEGFSLERLLNEI